MCLVTWKPSMLRLCILLAFFPPNISGLGLSEQPVSTTVAIGSTVRLNCKVSGKPPGAIVHWMKDAVVITNDDVVIPGDGRLSVVGDHTSGEYDLRITDVDGGDTAGYRCSVTESSTLLIMSNVASVTVDPSLTMPPTSPPVTTDALAQTTPSPTALAEPTSALISDLTTLQDHVSEQEHFSLVEGQTIMSLLNNFLQSGAVTEVANLTMANEILITVIFKTNASLGGETDLLQYIDVTIDTADRQIDPALKDIWLSSTQGSTSSVLSGITVPVIGTLLALDHFAVYVNQYVIESTSTSYETVLDNIDVYSSTYLFDDLDGSLAIRISESISLSIPNILLQTTGSQKVSVTCIEYRSMAAIMPAEVAMDTVGDVTERLNVSLGSSVVSVTMSPKPSVPFVQPFTLSFSDIKNTHGDIMCGSIDIASGWTTDGCDTIIDVGGVVNCHCDHMTNFALLVQVADIEIDRANSQALSIISQVGCAISITCLLITFVIMVCLRLRSDRAIILMNLVAALTLAQLLFLAGASATGNETLCRALAICLHYLFLAAFFWMLVEGVQLYIKVRNVFTPSHNVLPYYAIVGWVSPVVIVVVTASIRYDHYGNGKLCWLSTDNGVIYAFVGPVLVITLANLFVIASVLKAFFSVRVNAKKTDAQKIKAGIRASLVLVPLLGLTWLFGIFAVNQETLIFQYIFAILNSLQGMFIFLFHCALNDEVKNSCHRRFASRFTSSRMVVSSAWANDSKTKKTASSRLGSPSHTKVAPLEVNKVDVGLKNKDRKH
ncbi:adhesion G protein-coupled receptor L2-like isoform X2 [Ptychodera flava]|uniref:adhesion G protein-coupled receptor L2-like isoform X2 n=1 Tax=Ptychodera flava TaxID=63121 RepID=UPI00396A31A7